MRHMSAEKALFGCLVVIALGVVVCSVISGTGINEEHDIFTTVAALSSMVTFVAALGLIPTAMALDG